MGEKLYLFFMQLVNIIQGFISAIRKNCFNLIGIILIIKELS